MKKGQLYIIIFSLLLCGMNSQMVFGQRTIAEQSRSRPAFRKGELIVKIHNQLPSVSRGMTVNSTNTGSRNLNALNEQFGVSKVEQVFQPRSGRVLQQDSPMANVLLLKLREGVDEQSAMRAYTSLEEVEYAELNYYYYIFMTPNDAFFSSQYALSATSQQGIDAIDGWNLEQGKSSIIIGIVDTGIDYMQEDLIGKVIKGYDFVNNDYDPRDDNGHGTHVAGIAGALTNNSRGIAGVCPGCSLLAVKVVSADGSGSNTWIANGIANAVSLGAKVINLSLGGLDRSQTIQLAVQQAYQQGVVIVAASGNDGSNIPLYPAAFPEVIAVGATNQYGQRASFSNYGSHVAVMAPGQSIYSTLPGNRYDAWNGTSMASPHVAGLVGLILSRNSGLTVEQIRQVLTATANDLGAAGKDSYYGYGKINAYAALSYTPNQGGNVPTPVPNTEPTQPPIFPGLCGGQLNALSLIAFIALAWVNVERRRRK